MEFLCLFVLGLLVCFTDEKHHQVFRGGSLHFMEYIISVICPPKEKQRKAQGGQSDLAGVFR